MNEKVAKLVASVEFGYIAKNIALVIAEDGEEKTLDGLEVNWLESTDEFVVNTGEEILFDGLTENEANMLKIQLENKAIEIVKAMKGSM